MQRRKSVSSGPVAMQNPSVMQMLNKHSKHRATPSQIVEYRVHIRENYTQELKLIDALDSKSHAGSVTTLASKIITDFYESEDMDRVIREVTGSKATNFSRMNFFDSAAIEGLRQFFGASEGNTLAAIYTNTTTRLEETTLTVAIEALLEAAQFGSGRASQSLLEANELGIINLKPEEIQALVTAQIYWYRESLAATQLQHAQCLPALTKNKMAWDAVRLNPELFEDVLKVAYLDSGVKCQELIDANEHGAIVNLRPEELRRLVKNQIDQYLVSRQPGAIVSREAQQVPVLLRNQKVWAAVQQDAKDSYSTLLEFFHALTLELDSSIATPEAVALTAENNPMVFKGYFEDRATQKTIKSQEIVPEDRAHADARQRVLLALFALRHQVFGVDLKAVYAMRPAIDAKKETNKSADIAAAGALANATNELARKKAVITQETAQQIYALEQAELGDRETVTVTYDRDGWESSIRKSKATDTYARLLSKLDDARRAGKDIAKYNQRISGLEGQSDFEAYKLRKAERDARITNLQQKEQDAYIKLDQSFESFKTSQEEARQTRAQELQALKNQEEAMIKALVETNPITECIRLAFLVIAQELTAYGILTSDWRALIAKSLAEDLQAYSTGVFAFDFTPATMLKKAKTKESLPLLILANAPAYMALLTLFRNGPSPRHFWENAQDRLFDLSGKVVDVNSAELLKDQFPLISGAKIDDELAKKIAKALSHYKVESSSDPLLAMLNCNMLLALFISIKAIFPAEIDSSKAAELKAAAQLSCDRLNKIIQRPVNEIPSRLRNYLIMALVTLHDKAALGRLLSRDQSNPFYGVLLSVGLITSNDFSFVPLEDSRLGTALTQLSNSTEHAVTAASIDNSYIVLTYLKKWLGIEAQTSLKQATLLGLKEAAERTSVEPLKTVDNMTEDFHAQIIARQKAGQETDVDVLVFEFFNRYVAANYHVFCAEFAGKGGSLKPHESAWTHDMNSKVMQQLRAERLEEVMRGGVGVVSVRRSSLNSGVSFSQIGSSSAVLLDETLSADESDHIEKTDLEVKSDDAVAAPAPTPVAVEQKKPPVDILSQITISVAPPAPPAANAPPPPPPPPPRPSVVPPVTSSEEHKSQEKTGQPAPPPPPPPPARKKSALFQGANGLGLADELRARAATLPISVEGGSTIDQQLAAAASRNTSPSMARDPAVESILARRKAIDDDDQGDNISDSGWSSSDDEHDSGASSKPSVTGMFGGAAADSVARAAPLSLSPVPGAGSNG